MGFPPVDAAVRDLAKRDTVLAAHIRRVGPCSLRPREGNRPHFERLARSIVYQQLHGKAAASIWARVVDAVGRPFTAAAVERSDMEALRAAGLSQSKAASMKDLADHVVDGRVQLGRIGRLSDEDVVDELVKVRGIGRWTAEMFLMFQLGRLDIWPTGDFGVRNGFHKLYGLHEMPTPKDLAVLGEPFRPWRSVLAWYCWRAADTVLPD